MILPDADEVIEIGMDVIELLLTIPILICFTVLYIFSLPAWVVHKAVVHLLPEEE